MTAPVLGYPDPCQTYILDPDASGLRVGAVLSQEQGGVEKVIAYYSKTLPPPPRREITVSPDVSCWLSKISQTL